MRTEKQLLRELQAKDAELVTLVANVFGLGDLQQIDDGRRKELIRKAGEVIIEGEPENRQMLDRLLQERREISELIFDLRDDG
jgi:hypothetical protein